VNPDGTGKTLLKKGGADPRWSPDGTKVGYTGVCGGGGCNDVRWVTANGSSDFTVYQSSLDNDNFVDWSPDGLLLDGVGERPCAPCFESYTIHPDGTGYTVRPNGVGNWSPDGTKLVQGGVYVQNVDGSGRTQIASSGSSPDWQPITTNYARPKGASPMQFFLVPAYAPCTGSGNRTHGAPLPFPSCAPPSQTSGTLTVGTPDANGQAARSIAKVFYATRPGDLAIAATISDVRNRSDLSDYTGQLQLVTDIRITDRNNNPGPDPRHGAGLLASDEHLVRSDRRHLGRLGLQRRDDRQRPLPGGDHGRPARDLAARPGPGLRRRPRRPGRHPGRQHGLHGRGAFRSVGGFPIPETADY
jgi:hypothetical protein